MGSPPPFGPFSCLLLDGCTAGAGPGLPSRAPRGVGPALLGRQIAPASAVSLSSSARPPPPPTPPRARGGVALLIVVHDGPAVAATGLPPVSSSVPTPLAEAESARLSPPPILEHLECSQQPHIQVLSALGALARPGRTWSTWSAVISLTSRAGELRSAPSGPDDRDRATG